MLREVTAECSCRAGNRFLWYHRLLYSDVFEIPNSMLAATTLMYRSSSMRSRRLSSLSRALCAVRSS